MTTAMAGHFAVTTSAGVWLIDTRRNTTNLFTDVEATKLEMGPSPISYRINPCVTNAFADTVVVLGGWSISQGPLSSVEMYRGEDMTFHNYLPQLKYGRVGHSCASFGPYIVAAGGCLEWPCGRNYQFTTERVEVLDLGSSHGWRERANLDNKIVSVSYTHLTLPTNREV